MIAYQALVAGCALASLLAPPGKGMKMLIPLTPTAARILPALAIARDDRVMATGPLPGSLLVYSDRADTVHLLIRGILTTASPPAGCGGARKVV